MVCSLKIVLYGRRPCPKIIIVAARQEGAGREQRAARVDRALV